MFKKILLVGLFLVPGASAFAACPDIVGKWVGSYSTLTGGDADVGVIRLTITSRRIKFSGVGSYVGSREAIKFTENYNYNSSCKINFTIDGDTRIEGYAVTYNKMVLIGSDEEFNESFRIVADRFNADS
jgi:hypothetical protein